MNKEQIIKTAAKELIEQGNPAAIASLFSADYIAHAGKKEYKGHDFLKRWNHQFHAAIDNVRVNEVLFLSQDEETISWQRTISGKHVKDLRGIPASGKTVSWTEMLVSKFKDDKIVEEWIVSELAGELMLKLAKK